MRSSAATATTILYPKYPCLGSSGANSSGICCVAQPFHAEAGKQAIHTFYEQRHRRRQQQQPMPSFLSQLWEIDDESHTSALSWLPQGCFSWHSTAFWPSPGHFLHISQNVDRSAELLSEIFQRTSLSNTVLLPFSKPVCQSNLAGLTLDLTLGFFHRSASSARKMTKKNGLVPDSQECARGKQRKWCCFESQAWGE